MLARAVDHSACFSAGAHETAAVGDVPTQQRIKKAGPLSRTDPKSQMAEEEGFEPS